MNKPEVCTNFSEYEEDKAYIEKDCIFEFEGKKFESGGSFVSPEYIIAYLGKEHKLTTWHGEIIGEYWITSTWYHVSQYGLITNMNQVECLVNGVKYTGRSQGQGMIFRGKRKKGK